jgi:hypothetical protein
MCVVKAKAAAKYPQGDAKKNIIIWNMPLCSLVEVYRRFIRTLSREVTKLLSDETP